MKTAAFIAVALSGLALAAPTVQHAGEEWKDLSHLKYANSKPIALADSKAEKRAAAAVPVKDNRNLHYSHDMPIAKKPASA